MPTSNVLPNVLQKSQTTRIVLVDDDEDDYLLTADYLADVEGKNFDITWFSSYNQALRYLETAVPPDIFFFDYRLGDKTGIDLIYAVRQRWADVPIVLFTSLSNWKIDNEAMHAGATDFLVKGELDTDRLERCIRYAIERASSQRSLREKEAKYRRIFEQTQSMVYVVNAEGRIVEVNPAATALLAYSREEFLAMPDQSLYQYPEQRHGFLAELQQSGEVRGFEVLFRTRDGEARQCILSAILQQNEGDIHVMVEDVTSRRRAEQVRLLSEKLAATGRFVNALAHEVRNPLTNIDLSIEQLQSENDNQELDDLIAIIKRNSKRIGSLISELLDVARAPQLNKTPVYVRQLITQALEAAADRATLKNIRIVTDWPKHNPLVLADQPKLQMAVLNLIINAFEAMEEGQGVLTIGYARHGDECCISVEDNGCGIPQDHLARLFEPYFTGKTRGLGLGLATVLNIVQGHGGTVAVESKPGQGSRFEVWLPVISGNGEMSLE